MKCNYFSGYMFELSQQPSFQTFGPAFLLVSSANSYSPSTLLQIIVPGEQEVPLPFL
jgi:hypothetical protein